jgi:endonuclease/exonuclease/phosphatase family metal-dependent hydrolase
VLVETPGGYRFWVGTTHQKSKADNSVQNTKWRNREATRTHEILRELEQTPVKNVMLLGDFNDELGIQEFELEGGGDTIANIVGPAEHGFVLVTQKLAESGAISFGGYWNDRRRTFIDHAIVSQSMKDRVVQVSVFTEGLAPVASDHYPVVVKIDTAAAPTTRPGQ